MTRHDKRVALVTGGNRGIGYAIAEGLAKREITVITGVRDPSKGASACSRLQAAGMDVHFELLDVNDEKSIQAAVKHILAQFGRLDILVNNAGILIDGDANALDASRHTLSQTFQTNVVGPLMLCQQCIVPMKAGGYGRIVNMSSTLGSLTEMTDPNSAYGGVETPAYRLSKAALNAVTTLIAKAVRDDNILVNSACPGWVKTDMGGHSATRELGEGVASILWAATLPEDGPTGGFFRDGNPVAW